MSRADGPRPHAIAFLSVPNILSSAYLCVLRVLRVLCGESSVHTSKSDRVRSLAPALVLAAAVAGLGILPHLRFALAAGEAAWFKAAYDEDTYARLAVSGQSREDRGLSFLALKSLQVLSGGRLDRTLAFADAVFPFLATLAAFKLAARLVESLGARILVILLLLFGQEIFSLGCGAVTSPDSPWSLAALRSLAAGWSPGLVPDSFTPSFLLFRTPEPQVSLIVLFLHLAALVDFLRLDGGPGGGRVLAYLAASHAVLPWCYAFIAAPLLALEAGLAFFLLVGPRRREGFRFAATIVPYAAAWGMRLLAAVWAPAAFPSGTRHVFRSFAPILTPAVVYGIALLALFVVAKLLVPRGRLNLSGAALLAPLAFALPPLVMNQQIATGIMVTTRGFERYGNYPFLVMGGALLAAGLARRGDRGEATRAGGLLALCGIVAIAAVLVRGHCRIFESFRQVNEGSLAMARAVRAAGDAAPARILLEEAAIAPLLATRLLGSLGHEGSPEATFVLDYTDISLMTLPRFGSEDPRERASAEYHEGRVFERFARLGFSPAGLRAVLEKEAIGIEKGDSYFLHFLFPLSEVWHPLTDGRMTRKEAVLQALDGIIERYAACLRAPPDRWREPVLLITAREPAEAPTGDRWRLERLGAGRIKGAGEDLAFHAYRQVWRGEGG